MIEKRNLFSLVLALGVACLGASSAQAVCTSSATVPTPFISIQAAISSVPASLSGDHCIFVDTGIYKEQVSIRNIQTNGFRLIISSAAGGAPAVYPPVLSTAAFIVQNDSVSIVGITVMATNTVTYGILASSANLVISSVTVYSVSDALTHTGISVSSQSFIEYSSAIVQSAGGIRLIGFGSTVSHATATTTSASYPALLLTNSSSNTIVGVTIANTLGPAALLELGSSYNAITRSSMTALGGYRVLSLLRSSHNAVSESFFENGTGFGIIIDTLSDYNALTQVTVISGGNGGATFFVGNSSRRNTLSSSLVRNTGGVTALALATSSEFTTVSQSTIVTNGNPAFDNRVDSTTVLDCYIQSSTGAALDLFSGNYNTVLRTTMINVAASTAALVRTNYNWIGQSHIQSSTGIAFVLAAGADYNTVSQSTMISNGNDSYGLHILGASSNTIVHSYIQASTGVVIRADGQVARGNDIRSSVLVSTNPGGHGLWMGGAAINLFLSSSTLVGGPQGASLFMATGNKGLIYVSSVVLTGARHGWHLGDPAAGTSFYVSSVTFAGLPQGATAFLLFGGSFVSTFTYLNFADPAIATNVDAELFGSPGRITARNWLGARAGPAYERDSNGFFDWISTTSYPTPAGCSVIQNVAKDGSGEQTTIQGALSAIPASLSGDACVIVRDQQTYSEQVTVRNIATNGFRLKIMSDPSFVSTFPRVNPPQASTAAFVVDNASVTIQAIAVVSTNAVNYGIYASSPAVRLSSVAVDSGGSIAVAGIRLPGLAELLYSSVTVQSASGILLEGTANTVFRSSAASAASGKAGLHVYGSSWNAVSYSALYSAGGYAASLDNAGYNTLAQSAFNATAATGVGLYTTYATSNSIYGAMIDSAGGTAASLWYSTGNAIAASTMTGVGTNYTLSFYQASSNTVAGSYVQATSGHGILLMLGSRYNAFTNVRAVNDVSGKSAIRFEAEYNSVSSSTFFNGSGVALYVDNTSDILIAYSTAITRSGSGTGDAVFLNSGSSVTMTGGYVENLVARGVNLSGNSNHNALNGLQIEAGTIGVLTGGSAFPSSSTNTITSCFVRAGRGLEMHYGEDNAVVGSTIVALGETGGGGNAVRANENARLLVRDSYLQGKNTVWVMSSTHTAVRNSVLVSTQSLGEAMLLDSASVGLEMSTVTILTGFRGTGVNIYAGNMGQVFMTSLSIAGPEWGIMVDSQSAGSSLILSTITFSGLTNGATAIILMGGVPVSTFTRITLDDASIFVNVDGTQLAPGARVTMRLSGGSRAGPGFENDPNGRVDWPEFGAVSPLLFSGVSQTGLTVSWFSTFDPGVEYTLQRSTGAFPNSYAGNASSSTYNRFGSWTGLTPNTTYHLQVSTLNAASFTSLGSTATLAAAPTATAFLYVSSTAVSLDWAAAGNPEPGTRFELWYDQDGTFTAPTTALLSTSAAVVSGLTPEATYYFKARALNHAATPTAFDAAISTRMAPPLSSAPGTPAGTSIGFSSISWTWSAAASAASYHVYASTSSSTIMASTAATSFVQTGLTPNATFGLLVAGVNVSGVGAQSAAGVAYTLAAPPAGTSVAVIEKSSATVTWGLNSNPAGTSAQLARSEDNATFAVVMTSPSLSFLDTGLAACTTYFYRVRFINANSVPGPYDSTLSFRTLASTPAAAIGLSAESLEGNRIALAWTPSPSAGVNAYKLYYDQATGAVSYATPLMVLASTVTSVVTGVLPSTAAYTFALRAVDRCGVEEQTGVLALAGSVPTLSSVRAAIKTPEAGKRIYGNSVTVMAELLSGQLSGVQKVRFQFRASGGVWTDITAANPNQPNPDEEAPYFTHWDVTGLAPGVYGLRAVAYNVSGSSDAAASSIQISVDPVNFDIFESTSAAGGVEKRQVIANTVDNVLRTAAKNDDSSANIILPAGAFTASTVTASMSVYDVGTITTAPPRGLSLISAVEIKLCGGSCNLAAGATAAIILSYPASVTDTSNLQLYVLNENTGEWQREFLSTVNTTSRTVTGRTSHFSFFAIIGGVASSDLSNVLVYPVPWKPNGTNADEGKPFRLGDPTSGIIFANLPEEVTVKIFNLSGRLVARFDTKTTSGKLQWDGRNDDGREVVSGGYFAVISSPGFKTVIKKIAILR